MSSSLINIVYWAFSVDYWKEYKRTRKIKEVLGIFFKEESAPLQEEFTKQFDYPTDMTDDPVGLSEDGEIFYVLNFKSKELFENTGTQESAYTNSLKVLNKFLPIGITNYIEPIPPTKLDGAFSVFCAFVLVYDITPRQTLLNLLATILSSVVILSLLGGMIYGLYNLFL